MNNHATVQSSAPVSAAPLLQVSGALIAIIALILAAAWLVKRLGFAPKRTGVNGLKISASASLGARERVVVVDVEDARLVLGVTAGQINISGTSPSYNRVYAAGMSLRAVKMEAADSTPVEAGTNTLSQSVNLTYYLQ